MLALPSIAVLTRGAPQLIGRSAAARDPELVARLWTPSGQLTGVRFPLNLASGSG